MEYLWLALVMLAQISWAGGIFIDKFLLNQPDSKESVGTLVIISGLFNGPVALIVLTGLCFVHGPSETLTLIAFSENSLYSALLVGMLEILYLIPYFYALQKSDETIAPPLFQTVPLFGFALGFFFFNEEPTVFQVMAGFVIVFGGIILNIQGGKVVERIAISYVPILLMLLSSLILALAAFVFKDASTQQNYWGSTFWMAIGSFTFSLATLIIPNLRYQFLVTIRKQGLLKLNVLNESIDTVATFSFYAAVITGPSTVVIQLSNAYQPIILLLASFAFAKFGSSRHHEMFSSEELQKRVIGIAAVVCGSVLLLW